MGILLDPSGIRRWEKGFKNGDFKMIKDKKPIDIIIPSSSLYSQYLIVLLISILENANEDDYLSFHIITEDISKVDKIKISLGCGKHKNYNIEYIYPDANIIKNIPFAKLHIQTNLCNYKLKLASLFPNISKAIVLETDMIVQSSLSELYNTDVVSKPFAAVIDPLSERVKQALNVKSIVHYCNTGVFVANLDLWRELDVEQKFEDTAITYKQKLEYPDQDIFNITFAKNIYYLDARWNIYVNYNQPNYNEYHINQLLLRNNGIIHYAARQKPWLKINTPYAEYFWYYARKSPYYEAMLMNLLQSKTIEVRNNIDKTQLSDALNYRKNILKYWRYKILSNITFGNAKKHYKDKRLKWKQKIKNAKKLRRGV